MGPGQLYKRYAITNDVATSSSVIVTAAAQSSTSVYYVTDDYRYIYVLDPATGDSLKALYGPSSGYSGVTWDGNRGCLWLVGEYNMVIYQVDTFHGSAISQFSSPASVVSDIAYDPGEDVLWVLSSNSDSVTIYKVDPDDGSTIGQVGFPVFGTARGLAYDPMGHPFVLTLVSSGRAWIAEFSADGTLLDSVGVAESLSVPRAIDFTAGSFYIVAYSSNTDWYYDAKGVRKVGTFHCVQFYTDAPERDARPILYGPWSSVVRGSFKVGVGFPYASPVLLRLYNASGGLVWAEGLNLEPGFRALTLSAPKRAGVYFLWVKAGAKVMATKLSVL